MLLSTDIIIFNFLYVTYYFIYMDIYCNDNLYDTI